MYARLTGVSPLGLTAKAGGPTLSASEIASLESAAASALQRFGDQ
jgi:hypothetical protein